MTAVKTCQKCGKPLEFKGGNRKYCDTCRDTVNKENKKLWEVQKRKYITHFCFSCGKPIYAYKGHGQKYCKSCSRNIRLERVRLLRLAYYKKWKDALPSDLGTGWLSQNPKIDFNFNFNEEYLAIQREKKRLGLDTR